MKITCSSILQNTENFNSYFPTPHFSEYSRFHVKRAVSTYFSSKFRNQEEPLSLFLSGKITHSKVSALREPSNPTTEKNLGTCGLLQFDFLHLSQMRDWRGSDYQPIVRNINHHCMTEWHSLFFKLSQAVSKIRQPLGSYRMREQKTWVILWLAQAGTIGRRGGCTFLPAHLLDGSKFEASYW